MNKSDSDAGQNSEHRFAWLKFKFIYYAGTVHINQHHCKSANVSQKLS